MHSQSTSACQRIIGYSPTQLLPPEVLKRSITHMASFESLRPLMEILHAGRAISMGVLGASVAQAGGCVSETQRGDRCFMHRCSGSLARLFRTINTSFAHADHEMMSSALDATPAHMMLDCLLALLPRAPKLLVLEFGSMASSMNEARTELLVRTLLELPSRPHLLFVTVREWCKASSMAKRAKMHKPMDLWLQQTGGISNSSLHARQIAVEDTITAWCRRYDQSCLSYTAALMPQVVAAVPNFSIADVAGDCLHPHTGRHGADYLYEILHHWFRTAVETHVAHTEGAELQARRRQRHSTSARPTSAARVKLPRPVMPWAHLGSRASSTDRCYAFGAPGHAGRHHRHGRALLTPWRTAFCPNSTATGEEPGSYVLLEPAPSLEALGCADVGVEVLCPVSQGHRRGGAPSTIGHKLYDSRASGAGLRTTPRVWVACSYALLAIQGPNGVPSYREGKKAEGAVALLPGAAIEFPVDIAPPTANRPHQEKDARARVKDEGTPISADDGGSLRACVKVKYLTSYEHMGMAVVQCVRDCSCSPRVVDAHAPTPQGERNVSVYKQMSLSVSSAQSPREGTGRGADHGVRQCWIRMRVLPNTSSGEHKFKVVLASVAVGRPCTREDG